MESIPSSRVEVASSPMTDTNFALFVCLHPWRSQSRTDTCSSQADRAASDWHWRTAMWRRANVFILAWLPEKLEEVRNAIRLATGIEVAFTEDERDFEGVKRAVDDADWRAAPEPRCSSQIYWCCYVSSVISYHYLWRHSSCKTIFLVRVVFGFRWDLIFEVSIFVEKEMLDRTNNWSTGKANVFE